MPYQPWCLDATCRAESALAEISPGGLVLWRQLHRWLVGRPGDPVPPRGDIRVLTRTRIQSTRSQPPGVTDLLDALLVLAAVEADDEPRDAPILALWRPFIESTIAGDEGRHPLLDHWFIEPRGPILTKVLASMRTYIRIGLYYWERCGIPRRWMVEAKGIPRARLARYLLTQFGGFGPAWSTHLPELPPNRHLTREDFIATHLEMAAVMRRTPEILGIVSASWYYDPALEEVSPHLSFAGEVVREGGGILFEVRPDESTVESALARSAERRVAAKEGRYRPKRFARVWGRSAFLAWAERQPGWQMSLALEGIAS